MIKSDFKPGLESLRGIAALSVAVSHGRSALVEPDGAPKLFEWILYLSKPGSAVVVFFVLSGYVLGKSLSSGTNYFDYAIRRVVRIVPAFLFSVFFAAFVVCVIRIELPPATSTAFFQSVFWPAPTWTDLWENLIFRSFRVNGPTWSIWPELVGSAFIPIVFLAHAQAGRTFQWLIFAAVLAALVGLPYCRYLLYFYAGYVVVPRVSALIVSRSVARAVVLLAGILILALFDDGTSNYSLKTIGPPAIGATFLIAAIASTNHRILETSPLRFLGRVSYSFYLLHWPVFYLCAIVVMANPGVFPAGFSGNMFIMLASIAAAIAAADLGYRFIERPFMDAGRALISRRMKLSELSPTK